MRTESGHAPAVSVIIPARNASRTLPGTLAALARQTLSRESFEVLVVDDRSSDDTAALVRASGFARLVEMPRRGGSYAARNLGLDHARGGVIAFTDADCRPAADWLAHGLADLRGQAAELLGGRIDLPLRPRPSVAELADVCWHLNQARFVQMGFAATANLFVRRAVFDRIGRFNERLASNGDRELCLRATAHGFRLAYSHGAVVVHPPRARARDAVRKGFRLGLGRAQTDVFGQFPAPRSAPKPVGAGPGRRLRAAIRKLRGLVTGPQVFGIDRVLSQGYVPSPMELVRIELAAHLLIELPEAAGYVAGRLGARRTAPHRR
jgi:hypothetical protein